MSAELLRRAAALMRERAEAARYFYSDLHPKVGQEVPWHTEGELRLDFDEEQAPHIASWHPVVALAVADWLDGVALHLEARADEEWFDLEGDPISPEDTHAIGSALAVARAYLGEQP